MSRIGKKPILLPEEVIVSLNEGEGMITVQGKLGSLSRKIHPHVIVKKEEKTILLEVKDKEVKKDNALWGLFRTLLANMVHGVTHGWEKKLEINGIGYKFAVSEKNITLNVGFSHPVIFELPDGIIAKIEKNILTLSGIDKELVGEVAAKIRNIRPPEPYKGKGIKYVDEVIRRKAGKTGKAGA